MKRVITLLLVITVCISCVMFTSCGRQKITKSEAEEIVTSFFSMLSSGNYSGVAEMMHPLYYVDEDDYALLDDLSMGVYDSLLLAEAVKKDVLEEQSEAGIELTNGVTEIDFKFCTNALYDSDVDGALYGANGTAYVGYVEFKFEIDIVLNDHGYGIAEFEFEAVND